VRGIDPRQGIPSFLMQQSARTPRGAPKVRAVSAHSLTCEAARRGKSTGDAEASANLAVRISKGIWSAVAHKLKVFTSRENVAISREALREVLTEGRVVLRPDVAKARFEGSLVLSHEEFIEQKKIDIKLIVGRDLRCSRGRPIGAGEVNVWKAKPARFRAVQSEVGKWSADHS
jgi:hypothetical protein